MAFDAWLGCFFGCRVFGVVGFGVRTLAWIKSLLSVLKRERSRIRLSNSVLLLDARRRRISCHDTEGFDDAIGRVSFSTQPFVTISLVKTAHNRTLAPGV